MRGYDFEGWVFVDGEEMGGGVARGRAGRSPAPTERLQMRRVILGLVVAIFSVAGFAEGGAPPEMQRMSVNPLMRGKVKTDKTIRLEKMMNASPDELFQMWTTEIGVHAVFDPASKIEPKAGGAYTIIFDPAADPNGDLLGTNGARILEFERPGKLSFEWISFRDAPKKAADGPPAVAASLRQRKPIPPAVGM